MARAASVAGFYAAVDTGGFGEVAIVPGLFLTLRRRLVFGEATRSTVHIAPNL